jgi:tetratricopeptide (TPR) repeat protein
MNITLFKILVRSLFWGSLLLILALDPICLAQEKESGENEYEVYMSEAQLLIKDADNLFKSRNYIGARDGYQKALSKAEVKFNNSDMTEALSMIARTFLVENEIDTGYQWLHRAEKLAVDYEPLGWSRYQLVKGRFLWRTKQFEEATELFKELYDYCSDRKLYERAVDAAHMVAITGSHEEQVEWAKKGIIEAETGNVTGWLGPLWNNLGVTYEEMENYDSSLEAYMKAREYHYKYGTDRNKFIADYAVGHILVKLGKYEEAGERLRPVLAKCEEAHDDEFVGLTCRDLSEIGAASGNYKEAYALLIRAHKLLKEAEMDQWDPDSFRQMEKRIAELEAKL